MTRAPAERSHLSIGEVLSLLQDEFPDVTISKIRFLESQGLLDPERTPSGYRKFYDEDIERLRWILYQQKDHYLPLKVIKDRLDGLDGAGSPPTMPASGPGGSPAPGPLDAAGGGQPSLATTGVAVDERPDAAPAPRARAASGERSGSNAERSASAERARTPSRATTAAPAPARARTDRAAGAPPASRIAGPASRRSAAPEDAAPRRSVPAPAPASGQRRARGSAVGPSAPSLSLTVEELAEAAGLSVRQVRDLEGFGLVEGFSVGDATYYDGDDLIVARTAAGLIAHGIEARHMRTYRVAVDREAGLFEQLILPLLKQRNPDARRRASATIVELMQLGETMRDRLLRRALRDHLPPA